MISSLENSQHLGHQRVADDVAVGEADDGDVGEGGQLVGDGPQTGEHT